MIVSGSTVSSPVTQPTPKPLGEAPFSDYLRVLRENGYGNDADISESFYIDLLSGIELEKGKILDREQLYATTFDNILKMAETLLDEMSKQALELIPPPTASGPILKGAGADDLPPEQVDYLMRRQLQILEEEKARIG